jgi:hypothetical protein
MIGSKEEMRGPLLATRIGVDAVRFNPLIEITTTVNDLTTQTVIGGAHPFVAPLRQLVTITQQLKLRITQDIATIVFKYVRHCQHPFGCFDLQRMDAR